MTELIVRVADLCEAEGRVFRAMTVRLALGVAIILVSGAALATGVALLLGAVFIAIQAQAGAATAAPLLVEQFIHDVTARMESRNGDDSPNPTV